MLELAPTEHFPARQGPFELPDELFKVVGHHSVQAYQLAVAVIQHFCLGRLSREQESSSAGKGLDVGSVGASATRGSRWGSRRVFPPGQGNSVVVFILSLCDGSGRGLSPRAGSRARPIARGLYACVAAPG